MRLSSRPALAALALLLARAPAAAGTLGAGATRLVLGGEVTAALAPDDRGYFNFTDYSSSTLRQARLKLEAELRRGDRLALVAELRTINAQAPLWSALYVRLRPMSGRAFDLQAGRIPPVFGSFARRGYGSGNSLVGLPLAYQYLTTVRPDALPASADELLRWRGGGWRPAYAPGSQAGLPLVHGDLWDTGVEARLGSGERWQLAAAVTRGTLSHPRVRDDNDGLQLSARASRRFGYALAIGVSAARGAYLSRDVAVAPAGTAQRALGVDVEYARGHVLLRAEGVWSAWDLPSVRERPLGAWSTSVEGRVRLAPAFDAAARVEHLGFDVIRGATRRDTWDAQVSRVEVGLGFSPRRGVHVKLGYQYNWRDGGYVRREGFTVAQLGVRF